MAKEWQNGKFMSGQIDADIPAGASLLIFKNDKKSSDKQPDYHLYAVGEDSSHSAGPTRDRHTSSGPARGQQRQSYASTDSTQRRPARLNSLLKAAIVDGTHSTSLCGRRRDNRPANARRCLNSDFWVIADDSPVAVQHVL